jgi:hypothetical protein
MTEDLFHPTLEGRYNSTRGFCGGHSKPNGKWPKGCWGAANGWVMLVGPSPGRDPSVEGKSKQSLRPRQRVYYGLDQGKIQFGDARDGRWNRLTKALCADNEDYAYALTSVANLDWWCYRRECDIPKAHLREGCASVWKTIQASKPRVVVALTNKVWEMISRHVSQFARPDVDVVNLLTRTPIVFQIPGYSAASLLIKSQQHPSWPFKSSYYMALGKTVRSFLRQAG